MKKIYFALVFSLHFFSNAQNVGINASGNTPDASAMLDVSATDKGLLIPRVSLSSTTDNVTVPTPTTSLLIYNTNASITNGNGEGYYYNGGTPSSPNWVKLYASNGKPWETTGNAGTSASTNFLGTTDAVDLVLRTNNTEKMRIMSGGNVGIGIANPGNKLTVQTSTSNDGIYATDGTEWMLNLPGTAGNGSYNGIVTANDNAIIFSGGTQGTGNLVIAPWANATSGIKILGSNGNVGIGTSSPSYKLDITPNATTGTGIRVLDNGTNAGVQLVTVGDDTYLTDIDVSDRLGIYSQTNNAIGAIQLGSGGAYIHGSSTNIGIGTTSPNSLLTFNGGLQGKVRIITTDAAVTLDNTDFFVLSTNTFVANRTMTLPTLTAGTTDGKLLIIRNGGTTTTSGWNLTAAAGNTVSFAGGWVNPMYNAEGVILLSRGTVWYMIEF